MAEDKEIVKFAPGITILSMIILFALLLWDKNIVDVTTLDLFRITLISFLVGLGSAFAMKAFNQKTDFNISSISAIAFSTLLFGILGDVQLGSVDVGSFLSILVIALAIGIGVGFLNSILKKR